MIFLNANREPIKNFDREAEINEMVELVYNTVMRICPEEFRQTVEENKRSLAFLVFDKKRKFTRVINGEQSVEKCDAGACAILDNIVQNDEQLSCTMTIVLHPNATRHQIIHELFHTFSSQLQRVGNLDISKVGARISKENRLNHMEETFGEELNEGITEALTNFVEGQRTDRSAYYPHDTQVAAGLIGENIENNEFLKKVYFGEAETDQATKSPR